MTNKYEKFVPGAPLPETPGECVDLLKEITEVRIRMGKRVDVVRARESELKEHIINSIDTEKSKGVVGLRYTATVNIKEIPKLEDFTAFTAWVAKNNRFDMLQKRINPAAVMETLEERIEYDEGPIPGVNTMFTKSLSIKKN